MLGNIWKYRYIELKNQILMAAFTSTSTSGLVGRLPINLCLCISD